MCRYGYPSFLLLGLFLAQQISTLHATKRAKPAYTEEERRAEYIKRGNTWPPKIQPNSKGWKNVLNQRFAQVQALTNTQQKWDGIIQTLKSSLMNNYTEYGWGLTRAPEELTDDIRSAIYQGLPNARLEGDINVIDGPEPWFIDRPDLTKRVRIQQILL